MVYINQFISSKLNWTEKKFSLTMHSSLPETENVVINVENVDEPVSLAIRIPDWTTEDMEIITDEDIEVLIKNIQRIPALLATKKHLIGTKMRPENVRIN